MIIKKYNQKAYLINNKKSFDLYQVEKNTNLKTNFKNKSMNVIKNNRIKRPKYKYNMNNKNTINAKNNSHKSLDIFRSPKNNIYFSYDTNLTKRKINKKYKVFSALIKDIATKDGRINIYINYIFLIRKNKPLIDKYSSLVPDNNFSIN